MVEFAFALGGVSGLGAQYSLCGHYALDVSAHFATEYRLAFYLRFAEVDALFSDYLPGGQRVGASLELLRPACAI